MIRLVDWETRLSDFLESKHDAVFEWGVCDCGLLSADAAIAITGVDIAEELRGRYSTMRGSMRVVKPWGGLEGFVDSKLPVVPIAYARRGDAVWYDGSVGICYGAVSFFIGEEGQRAGLVTVPTADCAKAWAVGGGHR